MTTNNKKNFIVNKIKEFVSEIKYLSFMITPNLCNNLNILIIKEITSYLMGLNVFF